MAVSGLVSYESSEEEDSEYIEEQGNCFVGISNHTGVSQSQTTTRTVSSLINSRICGTDSKSRESEQTTVEAAQLNNENSLNINVSVMGPLLGPEVKTSALQSETWANYHEQSPRSLDSTSQVLLRDLTLPTVPYYDIPTSPSGSSAAATNLKFRHFLDLKRQGLHFNEKLARSSALKNPSLMTKLMQFADIGNRDQYATRLSENLWNPSQFPKYSFKDELGVSQQIVAGRMEEEKARGQRESVDFVPSVFPAKEFHNPASGFSIGNNGGRQSAAERIMAGLDRGRLSSSSGQGEKKRTRFEN